MARRILVKGTSGAGKTTLGRTLAQHLGVPFVELDALHHGPNWTAASAAQLQARVRTQLNDEQGWVVDGNYDSKLGLEWRWRSRERHGCAASHGPAPTSATCEATRWLTGDSHAFVVLKRRTASQAYFSVLRAPPADAKPGVFSRETTYSGTYSRASTSRDAFALSPSSAHRGFAAHAQRLFCLARGRRRWQRPRRDQQQWLCVVGRKHLLAAVVARWSIESG